MLNREEIKDLIKKKGLVKNFINLDVQLAPNGFDLTVGKILAFNFRGSLDFSNSERVVPEAEEIFPKKKNAGDKYGWWSLKKGVYKIKTNETFKLPKNLTGAAFPRSSLLRMGAYTQSGIWDAGFEGKAEFILVIGNPKGISIKQNARVTQIVFIKIRETKAGYSGIYNKLK